MKVQSVGSREHEIAKPLSLSGPSEPREQGGGVFVRGEWYLSLSFGRPVSLIGMSRRCYRVTEGAVFELVVNI